MGWWLLAAAAALVVDLAWAIARAVLSWITMD